MKAARLHAYHEPLKLESIDEPKADGPLDVIVRIGAAGLCRTDLHIQEGQWAEKSGVELPVHAGARERRLGARGRLGGHQRRGRGHGDRAPVHLLRAVPAVSQGRRHALPERIVSRDRSRWRLRRLCSRPRRARWSSSTPGLEPKDIAALADAGLTAIHAVKKAIPVLERRHPRGGDRRRRPRPHRDPVPEGDDAGRDHRHRPVREGAGAGRGDGRRPAPCRSTAATSTRSGR